MSVAALIEFQEICYGREVLIIGPARGTGTSIVFNNRLDNFVELTLNGVNPSQYERRRCVWLDNGCPSKFYNSGGPNVFIIRAAHTGIRNEGELLFLSGPMSEDQLTFAPPELLADNAWHKSISFSPLAGVVALEKVRHTGAKRIYMDGMDLYQGKQSLAYAHSLVDNARYISEIARADSRVVLCEALENSIRGLLL